MGEARRFGRRRSARVEGVVALTMAEIALAEGIADYLAAVRGVPGASLETARLLADRNAQRIAYPRPEGMTVADSFVVRAGRETPVRIYRPAGEGARRAIVYFHGGGFTTGSIESYDCFATALAEASGATVVSVHYMRLPEATPRALLEECYDALCWTAAMAEPLGISGPLSVAGDSAGAFIATLLAMVARDSGGPALACQLLAYGVYDLDETRAAYRDSRDPVLTLPLLNAVIGAYRVADARDPSSWPAPLRCADLSGLPPALMLVGAHDPVSGEGAEYADRLRAAGIAVQSRTAPLMPHGFLRAVRFSAPARAEMRWLGDAFETLAQG
jgi:acetyl esterase